MSVYYFFGCSLTAGDELADAFYRPNIDTASMSESEYYKFRRELMAAVSYQDYADKNKESAYPAILAQELGIAVDNRALNSISLRENIVKIIKLVLSESNSIKHLFVQVPPPVREAVLDSRGVHSHQMASPHVPHGDTDVGRYMKAKAMTHDVVHYSAEDFNDLLLLHGFLQQHKIPHSFIDIADKVVNRTRDLKTTYFSYLADYVKQLPWITLDTKPELLSVTRHLTAEGHKIMALQIKNEIFKEIS
jgi:hypothetical protein